MKQFFYEVIRKEYDSKMERSRKLRIKQAQIPVEYTIETYPFARQPHINRKRLLSKYDSLSYIKDKRNMILVGPTGGGENWISNSISS